MFQVYATTDQRLPLSAVADHARRVERLGYDGLCVPEATHDGLLAAGQAIAATERIQVTTAVLVAFPRSPMAIAQAAWDLQELSAGRFSLGLGSQVRGNVEGRYSTPWTPPVPRMREYVGALRAIFACWQDGERLGFEGEHYRFTRMQPFFDPGRLDAGPPPIWLGGIGPAMTALAGEAADGLFTHPTNTSPRYLAEVVAPRIAKGRARSERPAGAVSILASPLIATGRDPDAVAAQREWARGLLGFLYSTPAYWPSLDLHGFGGRGETLREHSRAGRWEEMTALVDDAMLAAFVPAGSYAEMPDLLRGSFEGRCDRLTFPLPEDPADEPLVAEVLAALRA